MTVLALCFLTEIFRDKSCFKIAGRGIVSGQSGEGIVHYGGWCVVTGRHNIVTHLEVQQVVTTTPRGRAAGGTCWNRQEILYGQASVTTLIPSLATSKHSNHDTDIPGCSIIGIPNKGEGKRYSKFLLMLQFHCLWFFSAIHIRKCWREYLD